MRPRRAAGGGCGRCSAGPGGGGLRRSARARPGRGGLRCRGGAGSGLCGLGRGRRSRPGLRRARRRPGLGRLSGRGSGCGPGLRLLRESVWCGRESGRQGSGAKESGAAKRGKNHDASLIGTRPLKETTTSVKRDQTATPFHNRARWRLPDDGVHGFGLYPGTIDGSVWRRAVPQCGGGLALKGQSSAGDSGRVPACTARSSGTEASRPAELMVV